MTALQPVDQFQRAFDVSRGTLERLNRYEALIRRWNRTINLVASSTIEDVWSRHFWDSAAVFELAKDSSRRWVDFGSGGGFPGLVVAILAAKKAPELRVTCVESDIRKCEFMRSVTRECGVSVGILSRRIEEVPPQNADVVSARALAPLSKLLGLARPHLSKTGVALFHKGEKWRTEVEEALESWTFSIEKHDSAAHPGSVVLQIGDIALA